MPHHSSSKSNLKLKKLWKRSLQIISSRDSGFIEELIDWKALRLYFLQVEVLDDQLRMRIFHKIVIFPHALHRLQTARLLRPHPNPGLSQIPHPISNWFVALPAQQINNRTLLRLVLLNKVFLFATQRNCYQVLQAYLGAVLHSYKLILKIFRKFYKLNFVSCNYNTIFEYSFHDSFALLLYAL